jgi:TPR repeat protein/transglutaminase-like putative cysteine protease
MRRVSVLLTVLLAASPAWAATVQKSSVAMATPAKAFNLGAPLPKWAQPLAEIPPTNRSDPTVVRLSEGQSWVGTQPTHLYNRAIQVNDSSALGAIGQFGIDYFSQYQQLTIHRIVILRGATQIDKTRTANIRALEREVGVERGMYGGATTAQLLLDDIRIGDTLWITYSISGSNPVFGQRWANDFSVDLDTPVELRRLTILHPAGRTIDWRQLGDYIQTKVEPHMDSANGLQRIRFEARNLEAVESEPSVPRDYLPWRGLQFSEYRDWQQVARWADGLFPHTAASAQVKALAQQFASEKTPEAKAAAALRWVQEEIRYFSVSIGQNSHRPQAPDTTLKRRFGDCKDKTYLLISLLRELGIDSHPVLLSTSSPRFPARILPTPTWFDHVIVQIHLDGRKFYVDPTNARQPEPLKSMPTAFPGAAGLVVAADTTGLITLPEDMDSGPAYEHVESVTIENFNGPATMEVREIYRGNQADIMRFKFSKMSASEQKKIVLPSYESRYQGITFASAPALHEDLATNEVEVRYTLALPKAVKETEQEYQLDYSTQVIKGTIGLPDKLVRNFPFALAAGKFNGRYRLQIRWPEQVRASDPHFNKVVDNAYFKVREEFAFRGNVSEYLMDFRLKQESLPAADVPDLQAQSKKLYEFVEGHVKVDKRKVATDPVRAYSYRDLNRLRVAGGLISSSKDLAPRADRDIALAAACEFVVDWFEVQDMVSVDVDKQGKRLMALLKKNGDKAEANQCLARLSFVQGNHSAMLKALGDTPAADGDPLVADQAWAYLHTGDKANALATMERYREARHKTEQGMDAVPDMLSYNALLARLGKPLPAKPLDDRGLLDGPWPRPVLAMQYDLLTPEQLLERAGALPADAQAAALLESWFYIGQRRLGLGDMAGAREAFQFVKGAGLPGNPLGYLAAAEMRGMRAENPHLLAAQKAYRNKDYKGALKEWQTGAEQGDAASQFALGTANYFGYGKSPDKEEALRWIRAAAAQSFADAQYLLGSVLVTGEFAPADVPGGIDLYRKAAKQGHSAALRQLGVYTMNGHGIEKDAAAGLKLLRQAADQGDLDAMTILARLYESGAGVAKSIEQALIWYERAAGGGSADAIYALGVVFQYGKGVKADNQRAVALYTVAAEKGHADAQLDLGYMYDLGLGVRQDYGRALEWYRKAAAQENAIAMYNIGNFYSYGSGVNKNYKEAMSWYRRSAELGYAGAMNSLGVAYADGEGVDKDPDEARKWYMKASDRGHALAGRNLAEMYRDGIGVAVDEAEAYRWYRKAAQDGDTKSQFALAMAYTLGRHFAIDLSEAAKWHEKAADGGDMRSQLALAFAFLQGEGVTKDAAKAVGYFRQAAEQGSAQAHSSLGYCYARGIGTVQDDKAAAEHFKLAAEGGIVFAQASLADMYARGVGVALDQSLANKWKRVAEEQKTSEGFADLAVAYKTLGKHAQAEMAYQQGLRKAESSDGPHSAVVLSRLLDLGSYYVDQGKLDRAAPLLENALSLARKLPGAQASVKEAEALLARLKK